MRFNRLFVFTQSPDGYLHDPNPATGAIAQPSSSDAPAAASSTPTPPASTTPPASSTPPPPASGAVAQPPASGITREADGWVPPSREQHLALEKARRIATARADNLDRDLKAERARVAALAGVTPQNPADAQNQEVIEAFYKIFPHMRAFQDPKMVERVMALVDRGDELSQASEHVWDGLTRRTVNGLVKAYADELNLKTEDIDEGTRRGLVAFFSQMANADPEGFRQRYETEDPKLIEEFITQMRKQFFEPARRAEASRLVRGQPRVPSSGPSRPVVAAPPSIDFADRDAVENYAVQYMKDRGHLQGTGESS